MKLFYLLLAGALALAQPTPPIPRQPILNVDSLDKLPSDPGGNIPRNCASVGNTDREASNLRDSRVPDHLLTRSDWDGKTLVLMGGSMVKTALYFDTANFASRSNLTQQKGWAFPARTRESLDVMIEGGAFQPGGAIR